MLIRLMRRVTVGVLTVLVCHQAGVAGETVEYRQGDALLEGVLEEPAGEGKAPAVLIIHQWMGITAHEKEVAARLAKHGYVAFAADIYGKDDRPADRSEAGGYAGRYKGDVALFRKRLNAGLEALKRNPRVDPERIAVIGYCFGGTGALELGRSGADVKAIVSFHGGLSTPDPKDGQNIKGSVLICHGGADSHVSDSELLGVMNELRATQIDWQVVVYSGAVHGFTHRHDPERYNRVAEERAWDAMMALFQKTLH